MSSLLSQKKLLFQLPFVPLAVRLDAIELTDPLLIDTEDCWLWLKAEFERARLG